MDRSEVIADLRLVNITAQRLTPKLAPQDYYDEKTKAECLQMMFDLDGLMSLSALSLCEGVPPDLQACMRDTLIAALQTLVARASCAYLRVRPSPSASVH